MARPLLFATFAQDGDRRRRNIQFLEPSKDELSSVPTQEPWTPAFVSLEEFIVLQRLCAGRSVSMGDADFLAWLKNRENPTRVAAR